MAKYASGEKPMVGDVVRCVIPGEVENLISYGEVVTVSKIDMDCIKTSEDRDLNWFLTSRFELIRRADAKMKEAKQEFEFAIEEHIEREGITPRLGWWRLRNGDIGLVAQCIAGHEYAYKGTCCLSGKNTWINESWRRDGNSVDELESPTDLIEFLAPLEIPNVPEPDIIDGPGTYELEDGEECLIISSSGGDWLVYIPSEGDTLHRYYHDGGHIGGAMCRIVKKLSDGIEL